MLEKMIQDGVIYGFMRSSVRILFTLVLLFILWRVIRFSINGLHERLIQKSLSEGESISDGSKRIETLVGLIRRASFFGLMIMGVLIILDQLGISIGPMIAGAGIFGVALGFGGQSLVKDIISGFFLIFENQMRVGDVVTVNGTTGLVEIVNFRTLVLRDLSGVVHVIPNGSIDMVSNMTKDWSAFVFDVGVAYKENTDNVVSVMKAVGQDLRSDAKFNKVIIGDLEVFGLDRFDDSAVVIKARFKTQPNKQWEVGREFQRRLKTAFDEKGIEIPFPHRKIIPG